MLDIEKLNKLIGTDFKNEEEITDHQLLAILVTLMATALGVSIFICKPMEIKE